VQVNAVYQRCERDVLATCNCAVMVRSGDDVLVIDRCVRQRQRMPPPLVGYSDDYSPLMSVVLYLNGKLTPGTRIHQLANGHKYIVSPCLWTVEVIELNLMICPHCGKNAVSQKFQTLALTDEASSATAR